MRFSSEKEILKKLKNVPTPDVESWDEEKKKFKKKKKMVDPEGDFQKWVDLKRMMFSPEEYKLLKEGDKKLRRKYLHTFMDWVEEKPRRIPLIIIKQKDKGAAEKIVEEFNPMGSEVFNNGASPNGKEPATHYFVKFNLSSSEAEVLDEDPIFDIIESEGKIEDLLKSVGLKRIEVEDG